MLFAQHHWFLIICPGDVCTAQLEMLRQLLEGHMVLDGVFNR